MQKNVLTSALLALFAASGPLAKWLTAKYAVDAPTLELILSVGQIATPLLAGGVFYILNTAAALVVRAKATPGVATVVLENDVTGALAKLANDEAHPHIVTAAQNEEDAKRGSN